METKINLKSLKPAIIIHPSEILRDELIARNIKQKEFADMLQIPASQLNEILKEKRDFNVNISVRIENVLGIKAEFWLKLQNEYNLQSVKSSEIYKIHKENFEKKYKKSKYRIVLKEKVN